MTISNPPSRTAYLVLGMHRSGTSALTQLLGLAGAELPANVMPGDEHNAKGYFEPWKIAMFNDRRLREAGGAWDDPFAHPYRSLAPRQERAWANEATQIFQDEFGESRFPLMKDPRVSVLMPLWRTVLHELEISARCVIPVRHPLAVAGSLAKRDGFPTEKSVLLWTAYMLAAERGSRDLPRAFVAYDALLSDWRAEVARIERAHDAPLPLLDEAAAAAIDEFLAPDLRHNSGEGDLSSLAEVGPLAQQVLDWCLAAAHDAAPDPAVLAEAERALAGLQARMGVYVSPVTRDLDAVRTELLLLRQQHAHDRAEFERTLASDRTQLEAEFKRMFAELTGQLAAMEAALVEARETSAREVFARDRAVALLQDEQAQALVLLDEALAIP